jgi:hypothetical protein
VRRGRHHFASATNIVNTVPPGLIVTCWPDAELLAVTASPLCADNVHYVKLDFRKASLLLSLPRPG